MAGRSDLTATLPIGRALLAIVCCACAAACAPQDKNLPQTSDAPPRVVSLAPHLTELVFSAGAGDRLVGVVAYSDYPEVARDIPRIGDAFNVDFERLAALSPDLVLAWKSGTPMPVRDRIEDLGFEVLVLETLTLEDVAERLIELGGLIGDEQVARARAEIYREVLRSLRAQSQTSAVQSVFYQISPDPLYTVGGKHYISEIIELCGGRNVFSDLQTPAAAVSHEAVLALDPDIILTDQRYIDQTLATWAKFSSLKAGGVQSIDGDLVTRPTLRLADGARQVCAAIRSARQHGSYE